MASKEITAAGFASVTKDITGGQRPPFRSVCASDRTLWRCGDATDQTH